MIQCNDKKGTYNKRILAFVEMSISAFNKCICGTLVTIVSLLPVRFDASVLRSRPAVWLGHRLLSRTPKVMLQWSEMWKRQFACWSSHLHCGTPYNTLSSPTRAFLIHSIITYQSLTSENIYVHDLAKFRNTKLVPNI